MDDVLHGMRDVKIFTKATLSLGYWHVMLDEASSDLTTFQTCFGQYRQRQLPFGLNSAEENTGAVSRHGGSRNYCWRSGGFRQKLKQSMTGVSGNCTARKMSQSRSQA